MVERLNNPTEINFDPEPFSPDFNQKLNRAIVHEAGKVALEKGTKVAVCVLPFALTACGHSPSELAHATFSTVSPNTAGHILGTLSAVEEAFERDTNKKFLQRALSVGAKYIAGFGIGYGVTHNAQSGESWLSGENLSQTALLGLGTYVVVNETSLKRFFKGVGSSVKNAGSAFSEGRKEAETRMLIRHIADDAFSSNIPTHNAAREKAKQMGISLDDLKQIHDQKQ